MIEVTLTLTEKQARDFMESCELYARAKAAQVDHIPRFIQNRVRESQYPRLEVFVNLSSLETFRNIVFGTDENWRVIVPKDTFTGNEWCIYQALRYAMNPQCVPFVLDDETIPECKKTVDEKTGDDAYCLTFTDFGQVESVIQTARFAMSVIETKMNGIAFDLCASQENLKLLHLAVEEGLRAPFGFVCEGTDDVSSMIEEIAMNSTEYRIIEVISEALETIRSMESDSSGMRYTEASKQNYCPKVYIIYSEVGTHE